MAYINRNTNEEVEYSELQGIYQNSSIPLDGTVVILNHSYIFGSTKPQYNSAIEKIEEAPAILKDGKYYKSYTVVSLTNEEIETAYQKTVPKEITKVQAMKAMKQLDIWVMFKSLVESDEDMNDEWTLATAVYRDNPLITVGGESLGMTPIQLDGLFVLAKGL